MERHLNNPAGRLLRFADYIANPENSGPIYKVINTYVGAAHEGSHYAHRSLGQLLTLPSQIEAALLVAGNTRLPAYMNWHKELAKSLGGTKINDDVKNLSNIFGTHIIAGLEICEDSLMRSSNESIYNLQQLDEIKDLINTAIDEILEADHNALSAFMLEKLFEIRWAIDDYAFCGPSNLETSYIKTWAQAQFDKETFENSKDAPGGDKLWNVFGKVHTLIQFANNAYKLLQNADDATGGSFLGP